ncbi:hypothetical protein CCR83_03925 [Rhodobacter veldkampii DSM 11550]|uniref:Uncharacterized protein n=1 Tax=Phaeovulum veldkampii DSM 11550 TaxID=1185920 RepID=A0A2T4JHH4_9RHOB|nr:hypothetical protein [Phaeovulum veldkampii]MBK5945618.1 hypothetical protein [Phaeovulum veldkampii DSM 11550]PTE17227.1 hypothetical protein C5F46_10070 [Phaeovulum veldkampii DSM 11550]TDQ56233.1 hypothetical protein EV658_1204 [Phaeovulum veldkampii DSM 11550]
MTSIWTDAVLLRALHLTETKGLTRRQAAEIILAETSQRVTENALIGQLYRLNRETDASETATAAQRPNLDALGRRTLTKTVSY